MLLTDHQTVNAILAPLRDRAWSIPNEGTTKLGNTGRVGNYIEQQFGISQNCSRAADSTYAELKTMGISRRIAKTSIGNVTYEEYQRIREGKTASWVASDPYRKMERTLWVFWEYADDDPDCPLYRLRSWHYLDLNELDIRDKMILESDYQTSVKSIRRHSYERSTRTSGYYLEMGTKGDSYYVYPNWKFNKEFVEKILRGQLGLTLSDMI